MPIGNNFGANRLARQINNMLPPDHEKESNPLSGDGGDGVEKPQEHTIENRNIPEQEQGISANVELSGEGNPEQSLESESQEEQSPEEIQEQLMQLQAEETTLQKKLQKSIKQQEEQQAAAKAEEIRKLLGTEQAPARAMPNRVLKKVPRKQEVMNQANQEQALPEIPLAPPTSESSQFNTQPQETRPQAYQKNLQDDFDLQMMQAQLNNMPIGKKPETQKTSELENYSPTDTLEMLAQNLDDTEPNEPIAQPTIEAVTQVMDSIEEDIDTLTPQEQTTITQTQEDLDSFDPNNIKYRGPIRG